MGYLTDEVRFHLSGDPSAIRLDRDIGGAFAMAAGLAGTDQDSGPSSTPPTTSWKA